MDTPSNGAQIDPQTVQALLTVYKHFFATRYSTISALTFYLLDCFSSFPDEVEYIWKSRWSFIKVLYVLNRYGVIASIGAFTAFDFLDHPTVESFVEGFADAIYGIWVGLFNTCVVATILQLRVWALYDQNKVVKIIASTCLACEVISTGAIAIVKLTNDHAGTIPGTPFCNTKIPSFLHDFWLPMISYDFILLVLVCWKAYEHYKLMPDKTWGGTRLLNVLLRDSVLYFLCGFVVYFWNTLEWTIGPLDLFQLGVGWALTIPPVAAAHMVLNMRKAYYTSDDMTEATKDTYELQIRIPTMTTDPIGSGEGSRSDADSSTLPVINVHSNA